MRCPGRPPFLLDCGATSLTALRVLGLDPGEISAVFISHLHGDHFTDLPFLILDGQFTRRASPLAVLSHADLIAHYGELAASRIVLTHMSAAMLATPAHPGFEMARDGLVIEL